MVDSQVQFLAQRLADNEKHTRDKALKMLRKHFKIKSTVGEKIELDHMLGIWKGLFYSMYMSDKMLVQETLAESISMLIHLLDRVEDKTCFIEAAFATFAREWNGIDVFRIDKMMMFVRRILRQALITLGKLEWQKDVTDKVVKILEDNVISPLDNTNSKPMGLKMHLCDIILEELAKTGGEDLDNSIILIFLHPYIKVLALSNLKQYVHRVKERIMRHLMRQSDLGIAEEEALFGRGQMPDDDEELEEEEEENEEMEVDEENQGKMNETEKEEENLLDPRAGAVDVYIPQLKLNYETLADALQSMGGSDKINSSKRTILFKLSKQFRDLHGGSYPLAINNLDIVDNKKHMELETEKSLARLQKFEKKIRNKYGIGKHPTKSNITVNKGTANNKKKTADIKIDEEDDLKGIEFSKTLKKKVKRKDKKPKKNKNKKSSKEFLAEKAELEKSVEDRVKLLREKVGLDKSDISPAQQLQSKKRKSMEFEVSDIDIQKPKSKKLKTAESENNLFFNPSNEWEVESQDTKVEPVKESKHNSSLPLVLNVTTTKNKQLGLKKSNFESAWDEPLKEGEFEVEIKSRKQILKEKIAAKKLKKSPKSNVTPSKGNRSLVFNLKQNKEHPFADYNKTIRNSPSLPFNAEKRPKVSVLKPSPSPILISKPLLKTLRKSPTSPFAATNRKLKRKSLPTLVL